MLKIEQATAKDSGIIHDLAQEVWEPTYGTILKKDQLDYMFKMMYSREAIEEQILKMNHVYFIAYVECIPSGYLSVERQADALFHLHKLYLAPHMQGEGLGNFMLQKAVMYAKDYTKGAALALRLHVNRHNKKALAFYQRMGFELVSEEDFAIGNNYYMNDYVLQLYCE